MKAPERPYWWPVLTDTAWCARTRADHSDAAGLSDEAVRDEYAGGAKYSTLWDHTGDALEDWEKLADHMFTLLRQRDELMKALNAVGKLLNRGLNDPMPDAPTLEGAAEDSVDIIRVATEEDTP